MSKKTLKQLTNISIKTPSGGIPRKVIIKSEEQEMTELAKDINLEELTKEINRLTLYLQTQKEEFRETLLNWCSDYRLEYNGNKFALINDETDSKVELPKKIEEAFNLIREDKAHWLFRLCSFTEKEILILLYKNKIL